jgi:hypothetical protein
LIGGNEPGEGFGVHASVAVRYHFEREVVDARQHRGRPAGEARELAAVTRGQVPLGGADLLFDEVEIVEQPFGRRRHATVGGNGRRQEVADFDQQILVVREACEEAIGSGTGCKTMRDGKILAVLLHLVGAEELRAKRGLLAGVLVERVGTSEGRREREQPLENCPVARFHFGNPFCHRRNLKNPGRGPPAARPVSRLLQPLDTSCAGLDGAVCAIAMPRSLSKTVR